MPTRSAVRPPPASSCGSSRRPNVDLVVMGAVMRRLDDRPSLGPTVERVLDECEVTVAVVVVPVDL